MNDNIELMHKSLFGIAKQTIIEYLDDYIDKERQDEYVCELAANALYDLSCYGYYSSWSDKAKRNVLKWADYIFGRVIPRMGELCYFESRTFDAAEKLSDYNWLEVMAITTAAEDIVYSLPSVEGNWDEHLTKKIARKIRAEVRKVKYC